ncbi:MAG TPA: hypothetical protein VF765_30200 [Polyangiaceae bacterium]
MAGLGLMCLIAGNLGYVFQPVPPWIPWRHGLAYASGVLLLVGGLAVLVPKTTARAAQVLTAYFFFVWLLLLNVPTTVAKPTVVGHWEGCGLDMTILAGSWILLALSRQPPAGPAGRLFGESGVTLARRVYAAGLPLIGLAHFASAREATEYVPTWFPLRIDWVYLTGAAHVAAGLAILFGVVPRLAAVLEAAQVTAFVVLSHVPSVLGAPRDRIQWGMFFDALAIAGSAWLVATTFRGRWLGIELPWKGGPRRVAIGVGDEPREPRE